MRIKRYLSYSQYNTFNSSINNYIKIYINGEKLNNKYLDFGKKIGEGLEDRNIKTTDKNIIIARNLIRNPKETEKEFLVDFEKIPLFGRLDGFNKKEFIIDEYKTSLNKWTQSMVNKSEQLTFYAIMVSKFFNINPNEIKIRLHWLETCEEIDKSLFLTGKVKVFETKRTIKDFITIYPKVNKTWIKIEELINDLI